MNVPKLNSEWAIADDETGKLRMIVLGTSEHDGKTFIKARLWNTDDPEKYSESPEMPLTAFWEQARPLSLWQRVKDVFGGG